MTCASSLQNSLFAPLGTNLCAQCCSINPLQIAEAIALVITFPLSAIYMAYCLVSWRSMSNEKQSMPIAMQPGDSADVSPTQEAAASLYRLSKQVSSITVLVKYILSSASLFIIFFNANGDLVNCNPLTGPNGLTSAGVEAYCSVIANTNYHSYVLVCCATIFMMLLLFDMYVFQLDHLIGAAVPIGAGAIVLCIVVTAVSGTQIAAILATEVVFSCSSKPVGEKLPCHIHGRLGCHTPLPTNDATHAIHYAMHTLQVMRHAQPLVRAELQALVHL